MRILLISRCPPYPLYLGDRLIVYHLAEELELRRHQIDLLAFANRPEDWHEQEQYDARFMHVELLAEPRRTALDYARRALIPSARWPRRAAGAWSPDMWQAIQTRLKSTRYDVIHLFGGIQVYEYWRALGGLPALITPYESYSLYLRRLAAASPSLMTRARLALAQRFEGFMFTPYRRVVVVSERDRDELQRINPALPVDVIPNGVDTYLFRPRPVKRIPALLFIGNYDYAPNVDAALRLATDILPAVRQHLPDVRLWLVGNNPPPEMRALASDIIRVTGRVPDVRPYLARAAAFVSPLRLGAGIKNKVLEGLAMGCPVIATPLSVDGIHARDGEHALIADGKALVGAVLRALTDAELAARLAVNGRHLIETRYSWGMVAAQYEALYQAVQTSGGTAQTPGITPVPLERRND